MPSCDNVHLKYERLESNKDRVSSWDQFIATCYNVSQHLFVQAYDGYLRDMGFSKKYLTGCEFLKGELDSVALHPKDQ